MKIVTIGRGITGGPVAKSFNTNFAALYDRLGEARARPCMLYAADDEARAVTEQLIQDAGYEPARVGDLGAAHIVEDFLAAIFGVRRSAGVHVFYRFAPPEAL